MARSRAYAIAFFLAALLMLGGALFFAHEAWESEASASWPHTSGVIVASYTERTCGGARTSHSWEARIRYEYRVDGRAYTGRRVTSMRIYCDPDRNGATGWLQKHFPRGKLVEVYYNPSDPEAAFLHPGVVSKMDIAMIFASLVISALMALGGLLSLRSRTGPATSVRRSVKFSFRIGSRRDDA